MPVSVLFSVLFSFSKQEYRRLTLLVVFLGTCCGFCVWGVAVLFECCDALLAAFYYASAFKSDLSKWETGKVTTMLESKCILLGIFFFFQTRILGDSHFFLFFWGLTVVFVWGVAVLFECCDALFAAFWVATVFNSDLSKWETGKVTTMYHSKCTLLGVVFFFSNKKNLRKIQKYESDPPTTNGVCSFSSCIDLFPLFQSFTTAGSVDRCVEVIGSL